MSRNRMPNVATQLKTAMEDLFGFKEHEQLKKDSKTFNALDFLSVVFAADNLFAGMTLILFLSMMVFSGLSAVQGLEPNYMGIIVSSLAGGIGVWTKIRSDKQKESAGLMLVNEIMDRQFQYEQMQNDNMLKQSQMDFFAKELIQLIAKCEPERLESINLALTALVYDKEGIIHSDLKDIKSLLSSRQAEELLTIAKLKELSDKLPNFEMLERQRKTEVAAAERITRSLELEFKDKEKQYQQLMNSLNVGVIILDETGIIEGVNEYARLSIPHISQGVGQHWTWNMKDRPPPQVSALIKLINTAMAGKSARWDAKNYLFADGSMTDLLIFRAVPQKTGDIVDKIYITLETSHRTNIDSDIESVEELEKKTEEKVI